MDSNCPIATARTVPRSTIQEAFSSAARSAAKALGSAPAFCLAVLVIVIWALTGPMFHFSDTWQLIINTGTTIVTFLMVFLIQNTQNRDSKAIHLKLDELIRAQQGARNQLVDLEKMTEDDLDSLEKEFERVRKLALSKTFKNGSAEKRR